jgi:NAD(P)-dependent dehydrogenase (short-subunit alcohol dehydrogenase family)
MGIPGKVVVVTGASMGIGEAIVHRFLREDASVVLASRDLVRVEAARQRTAALERTLAVACDVTVRAQIERLLAAASASDASMSGSTTRALDLWIQSSAWTWTHAAASSTPTSSA